MYIIISSNKMNWFLPNALKILNTKESDATLVQCLNVLCKEVQSYYTNIMLFQTFI